jgi:hypothetical protein
MRTVAKNGPSSERNGCPSFIETRIEPKTRSKSLPSELKNCAETLWEKNKDKDTRVGHKPNLPLSAPTRIT